MPKAIRIEEPADPSDAVRRRRRRRAEPAKCSALEAIGLNLSMCTSAPDCTRCRARVLGLEAGGSDHSGGDGVDALIGGRSRRLLRPPAGVVFAVAQHVTLRSAPCAQLRFRDRRAMTAQGAHRRYCFRAPTRCRKVQTILFHAASGGVGSIAMQWGARSASPSSAWSVPRRAELARRNGARTRSSTRHENSSIACARSPTGRWSLSSTTRSQGHLPGLARWPAAFRAEVSFGNSSGPAAADAAHRAEGSLYINRPS